MKKLLFLLFAVTCASLHAGSLSVEETTTLKTTAKKVTEAAVKNDADTLIATTHPSLHGVVGGKEAFDKMVRDAMKQLAAAGVQYRDSTVGEPSETYTAGEEEVCTIPHGMILEVKGKKVKTTGYLIAIRTKPNGDWTFLDSAGFAKSPELLWQLLPKLPKDIKLPEHKTELIP